MTWIYMGSDFMGSYSNQLGGGDRSLQLVGMVVVGWEDIT
jgi:hypothetical protein